MAKNESTAVNELINLVSSTTPRLPAPGEDLMFAEPPALGRSPAKGARMTGTMPGAGDVPPLPRGRAPSGTRETTLPSSTLAPPAPPAVRMTTAPATRQTTIPPLPTSSASLVPPPVPTRAPSSAAIAVPPPAPHLRSASAAAIAAPVAPHVAAPGEASIEVDVDMLDDDHHEPGALTRAKDWVASTKVVQAIKHAPEALERIQDRLMDNPAPSSLDVLAAARTTRPSLPLPRAASAPPSRMPVVAPFEPTPPPSQRALDPIARFEASEAAEPSVTPAPHTPGPSSVDLTDQTWFEESRAVERVIEHNWSGTVQVPRRLTTPQLFGKLALPMGAMILLGVFVGGYVAFDGEGRRAPAAPSAPAAPAAAAAAPAPDPAPVAPTPPTTAAVTTAAVTTAAVTTAPATAPAAVEAPAVVAAPAPAPTAPAPATHVAAATPAVTAPAIAAPTARPALVDIRIDSQPAGATVMLVDNGKTTFLGSTPISTALDPSRTYDLVFTYADRPTQLEHLDPRVTTKLAVVLGRTPASPATPAVVRSVAPTAAPKAAPKAAPAPKVEAIAPAPVTAPKVAPARVAPKAQVAAQAPEAAVEPAVAKPVVARPEKAATLAAGDGTLMISTKPPCQIFIDGKATGLTTPQRALALPAGAHKVTLVNKAENITKTLSVQITAAKPTKVIQDLMNP